MKIIAWMFYAVMLASLNLVAEGELDLKALNFESKKRIESITTATEEENYHALCRAIAEEENAMDDAAFDNFAFDFEDDESYPSAIIQSPAEQVVDPSEEQIVDSIKDFIKEHPAYATEVKAVIRSHLAHCKKDDAEVIAAEIAIAIAHHFRRKGDVKNARLFYRLALHSPRGYDDFVYLELGSTFLEYVNRLIDETKPQRPTAQMFSALLEAIRYNSYDTGGTEPFTLGDARNIELKRQRDGMVRFQLSPSRVLNDTYYGEHALARKLYCTGFVDRLIADKELIRGLWQLRNFNASSSETNIFRYLELRGFVCVRGYYVDAPQYILINKSGFLVRVKRNALTKNWEFSVGLSLKNPVLWDDSGEAIRTIKTRELSLDGSSFSSNARSEPRLVDVRWNEIAKITFRDGLIQVLPPAHKHLTPWWGLPQLVDESLREAHRPVNTVGKYVKSKRIYDFSAIDYYCM